MSAPTLNRWLDPAFIREMVASNEASAPAVPMQSFRVIVGPKDAPRMDFTAEGPSSTAVFMEHAHLGGETDRVVVLALGARS